LREALRNKAAGMGIEKKKRNHNKWRNIPGWGHTGGGKRKRGDESVRKGRALGGFRKGQKKSRKLKLVKRGTPGQGGCEKKG